MATRYITEEPVMRTAPVRERETGAYYRQGNIAYVILGIVELALALRFVFLLLGANSYQNFAGMVYAVTSPLVAPFTGIFGPASLQRSTFDPSTLVAMAVYAVVGWAAIRLIAAAHRRPSDPV